MLSYFPTGTYRRHVRFLYSPLTIFYATHYVFGNLAYDGWAILSSVLFVSGTLRWIKRNGLILKINQHKKSALLPRYCFISINSIVLFCTFFFLDSSSSRNFFFLSDGERIGFEKLQKMKNKLSCNNTKWKWKLIIK